LPFDGVNPRGQRQILGQPQPKRENGPQVVQERGIGQGIDRQHARACRGRRDRPAKACLQNFRSAIKSAGEQQSRQRQKRLPGGSTSQKKRERAKSEVQQLFAPGIGALQVTQHEQQCQRDFQNGQIDRHQNQAVAERGGHQQESAAANDGRSRFEEHRCDSPHHKGVRDGNDRHEEVHRSNGIRDSALNQAQDVEEKRRPMQIIVRLGCLWIEVLDGNAVKTNDAMGGKGMRDCRKMCARPGVNIIKICKPHRQPDNQQARQSRQYPGDHIAKQLSRWSGFFCARFRADRDWRHRNLTSNTSPIGSGRI
jgi:hypothetical protein